MCVCSANLGFSVEKIVLVLVYGTYYVPARTAVQASCLVRVKKSKNEMFKWIADTWPGLSRGLVLGRADMLMPLFSPYLATSLAVDKRSSKFANFQSPTQSSPQPSSQHCRTASRTHVSERATPTQGLIIVSRVRTRAWLDLFDLRQGSCKRLGTASL